MEAVCAGEVEPSSELDLRLVAQFGSISLKPETREIRSMGNGRDGKDTKGIVDVSKKLYSSLLGYPLQDSEEEMESCVETCASKRMEVMRWLVEFWVERTENWLRKKRIIQRRRMRIDFPSNIGLMREIGSSPKRELKDAYVDSEREIHENESRNGKEEHEEELEYLEVPSHEEVEKEAYHGDDYEEGRRGGEMMKQSKRNMRSSPYLVEPFRLEPRQNGRESHRHGFTGFRSSDAKSSSSELRSFSPSTRGKKKKKKEERPSASTTKKRYHHLAPYSPIASDGVIRSPFRVRSARPIRRRLMNPSVMQSPLTKFPMSTERERSRKVWK
eukprot:TRINITY_DN1284_c0_g1_i1.p1 TRINITY_DN1284_c0_g1~~TRINITY_DN1284_c0_g1_i1.p1  ORF type:complete len:329 (-),score=102.31 TRINITY_DN1284_c0_g1_i1:146-1132(-)